MPKEKYKQLMDKAEQDFKDRIDEIDALYLVLCPQHRKGEEISNGCNQIVIDDICLGRTEDDKDTDIPVIIYKDSSRRVWIFESDIIKEEPNV